MVSHISRKTSDIGHPSFVREQGSQGQAALVLGPIFATNGWYVHLVHSDPGAEFDDGPDALSIRQIRAGAVY